jgi:hypothetical protein
VVSGRSTLAIDFPCHKLLDTEQPVGSTTGMTEEPVALQGQSSSLLLYTVSHSFFFSISTQYVWLTSLVG